MDITTDEYRENARKIISFAKEKLRTTDPSAPELRRLLIEGRLRRNFREHLCSELDIKAHRYDMVSAEIFDKYFEDYRDVGYFSTAVVGSQILHKPIGPPPRYVGNPELYTGLSKWVREGTLGREAAAELLQGNVSAINLENGSARCNPTGSDPRRVRESHGECASEKLNRVIHPTRGLSSEVSVAATVSDHNSKNHVGKLHSKPTELKNLSQGIGPSDCLAENSEQESANSATTNELTVKEEINSKNLIGDGKTLDKVRTVTEPNSKQGSRMKTQVESMEEEINGNQKSIEVSTNITAMKLEDKSGSIDSNITANPLDPSLPPIAEFVRHESGFARKQTTSATGDVKENNKSVEMGNHAHSVSDDTIDGTRPAKFSQNDVKNAKCKITGRKNLKSTLEGNKGASRLGNIMAKESASDLDSSSGYQDPEKSPSFSSSKHQLYGDPLVSEPTKSIVYGREVHQKVLDSGFDRIVGISFANKSKSSSQRQPVFQDLNNTALVAANNANSAPTNNSKDVPNTGSVRTLTQMKNLDSSSRGDPLSQNLHPAVPSKSVRTSQNSQIPMGNVVSAPKSQKFILRPPYPPDPMFSSIGFGNGGDSLGLNSFLQLHPPYSPAMQQPSMVQANPQHFIQQNAGLSNTSTQTFGQKRRLASLYEGSTELNTTGPTNMQKRPHIYPPLQPHKWSGEAISQHSPKHQIVPEGTPKGHTSGSHGLGHRAAGNENHEGARKQRKLPKSLKKISNIVEKYDLDQ